MASVIRLLLLMRALEITLSPGTYGYTLEYVDDILVHSPNTELRVIHLNTVLLS
jgi:hypothetical protein